VIRALAQQQGAAILGREQELTALREFLEAGSARAFVVSGPPGIGKTTLWRAALELATSTGLRVLSARAAEAESQLSFAGLSDLLESVDSELGALPAPQRRALEAAVLRAEPDAQPQSHLALGTGLLGVLRALARPTGLLLALDDAQWLDEASCAAIGFAARRLSGEPVKFLLTRRAEATSRLEQVFPTLEVASAKLAGLSFGAIRAVLSQGENAPLPRRVLRQVYETSGGNCLFALEIARLLARRGPSEVGEDLPVPELVEEAVAARVASLPAPAADALLVAALSPGVPRPQLVALVGAIALDQVRDAAVVTIERDRVRAAHPLLAAAVLAQSTPEARRSMHRALGAVVTEDELRWRHLALGADGPDAALATQLTRISGRLAAGGAAGEAAELAGHAFRLTPAGSTKRAERLVELAERLVVAGEHERAGSLLRPELAQLTPGPVRARAHMVLAESDFAVVPVEASGAHLERALADSFGDAELHTRATARWARHLAVARVERVDEAESSAWAALGAAQAAGPTAEREVLFAVATIRVMRGLAIDQQCERFAAISTDAFPLQRSVERLVADRLARRGQVERARSELVRLLDLAEERGEGRSSAWLVHQLCELELRAGEWVKAEHWLEDWAASAERSALDQAALDRCRALLAAGRGDAAEGERWAGQAIDACRANGLRWDELEALRARGLAAMAAHDHERAVVSLSEVWEHCEKEGVEEPGLFPVAPDLVEALVGLGRRDEAGAVTRRVRRLAREQQHPWGLATARFCEALLALSAGPDAAALAGLKDAARTYRSLGLGFDSARALLAAGRAARSYRSWQIAREALGQAAALFDLIGSDGWAAQSRAELTHVSGRRPNDTGGLSSAEHQVVALAARGQPNKQIAAQLHLSVYTVESHLAHAYRKLGVSSRSQLAALAATTS